MAEISTAISDLVLAVSSFYIAYYVVWRDSNVIGACGLCIIGTAASLGVFRFSLDSPGE